MQNFDKKSWVWKTSVVVNLFLTHHMYINIFDAKFQDIGRNFSKNTYARVEF